MIVEFKIGNFLSIRSQQTFSMVANNATTELSQNLCAYNNLHLLRAAVFYGANASGKSNFLSALHYMRNFVVNSAKESQQGEEIQINSFAFDEKIQPQPSEFEITFIKEKIRYQYGFSVDKKRILEEWLFAYPQKRPQQWFSRQYDKKDNKYSWKFSEFFKGGNQIKDLTISNVLFLSNAVKLNNEQLVPVFDWFQNNLKFLIPTNNFWSGDSTQTLKQIKTSLGKQQVLKILNAADNSIADIDIESQSTNSIFPEEMPQDVKDYLKEKIFPRENFKITFKHTSAHTPLKFSLESNGTHQAFRYAGYWIDALEEGRTLIVDELDASLHPLMVEFLIGLICDPNINKKNAQLIFSTHDTSLLDNELFRRDQIFFVEKDNYNSTQIYSLLDFSPRKHEAIRKGYLQGRYGALPYIGEWRF